MSSMYFANVPPKTTTAMITEITSNRSQLRGALIYAHNGDINLAKKLIDVASDSGADFIKFQTFKADNIQLKNSKKPF